MMDNPAFDGSRAELGGHEEDGESSTDEGENDGDDDAESESSTGDGDGDPSACAAGHELCAAACTNLQFDDANCGRCGQACGSGELCGEGVCRLKKHVFVTSERYPGSFGGPGEADQYCDQLASATSLPGSYFAWVSGGNSHIPGPPVPPLLGAYVLPKGPVIAWSWPDFISGRHLAPINHDEQGNLLEPSGACDLSHAVWTGMSDIGEPAEPSCAHWLSSDGEGLVGNAQAAGAGWSASDCQASCALKLPIYCVQE